MLYYARLEGKTQGPFPLEQLQQQGVRPSTWVWCKGMDDWQRARDVADICRYFRQSLSGSLPSSQQKDNDENALQAKLQENLQNVPVRFRHIVAKSGQIPGEPLKQDIDYDNPPRNFLPLAIIAVFIGFWPAGVVAIYFAVRSNRAWKNGEKQQAHSFARQSKIWTLLSFFLGLIMIAVMYRQVAGF